MSSLLDDGSQSNVTVCDLVLGWINDAQLTHDEKDVFKAFFDAEFVKRLRNYRRARVAWRCAQFSIWLAIALLGLLGSVLAAAETGRTMAIVAGALVGILTTFAHAAHPSRQADGYESAQRALRDEAWALVSEIAPYERAAGRADETGRTDAEFFRAFIGHIREIVNAKREATRIADLSA